MCQYRIRDDICQVPPAIPWQAHHRHQEVFPLRDEAAHRAGLRADVRQTLTTVNIAIKHAQPNATTVAAAQGGENSARKSAGNPHRKRRACSLRQGRTKYRADRSLSRRFLSCDSKVCGEVFFFQDGLKLRVAKRARHGAICLARNRDGKRATRTIRRGRQ